MLPIKGFIENSLIEYPEKISSVIFLSNCNFRCPICQNPNLILNADKIPNLDEDKILEKLNSQKKWIDAVMLTGGEPMMHDELPKFVEKIKAAGFLVGIETNGTNPQMLKQLIEKKLLDYVAMDIKTSLEKYEQAAASKVDKKKIQASVDLIRSSGIDYEFRATVLPKFFTKDDAKKIGEWLKGSKVFFIQQFRPGRTLDKSFQNEMQYTHEQLHELAEIMQPYFERVEVRGV